jgi:hypothetical protein
MGAVKVKFSDTREYVQMSSSMGTYTRERKIS